MIPNVLLQRAIDRALLEDLAGGDVTTLATVGVDVQAVAHAVAKQQLVACGSRVFARVFTSVDPGLRVEELVRDGGGVEAGTPLYRVEGAARSILMAERTALNFLQRMSGIATITRRYVDELPKGSATRIVDTRKTTPGLRAFERYAVRTGGAHNHRDSLASGIMIKDNHIRAAGGIAEAVRLARQSAPHVQRVEVEVESLEAVEQALTAGVDVIMLDNFEEAALARALELVSGCALVEVSGGVTLQRIRRLGELGVDVVSVGALTHSAAAADISLDLELLGD